MYSLEEHRHRFAAWAAARAAQRGFAKSEKLIPALEKCKIRNYLSAYAEDKIDAAEFERLHRGWCGEIVTELKRAGVRKVTWGRAAKLVAVYLKSMIVVGLGSDTVLAHIAHPPVDYLLLQELAHCKKLASPYKKAWKKIRWTQLDEEDYYHLIQQLRSTLPPDQPFWMLEKCWFPVRADK